MIACCRSISIRINLISKNVRTFATPRKLLNLEKFDLLLKEEKIGEYWTPKEKTNDGTEYRMLHIQENVRALLISREQENTEMGCSIRVGAGSYDEVTPGIAHLLEHVIAGSNLNTCDYEAFTFNDRTEYSFTNNDDFWKSLSYWTNLMFSSSKLSDIIPLIDDLFTSECKQVDGEFHEKRGDEYIDEKRNEIIGLTVPRWDYGNLEAFETDKVDLTKIEEFRKLYQERPVFVCIQASLLSMKCRQLGTECDCGVDRLSFFFSVSLTKHGLDNIQKVISLVFEYIKFLKLNWKKLDKLRDWYLKDCVAQFEQQDDFHRLMKIIENFDEENEHFDEKALYSSSLSADDEDVLLSNQLLKNEKIVYSISTKEPENTAKILNLNNEHGIKTSQIYKTKYGCYETGLLEQVNVVHDFKLLKIPNRNYKIAAFIKDPKDVAYQVLCEDYITLQVRDFLEHYNTFFGRGYTFYSNTTGIIFRPLADGLDPTFEELLKHLEPFTMDDDQFHMLKDYTMKKLTVEMTDSVRFAESLLNTAFDNIHRETKVNPIPMQYETLRGMTKDCYIEHFVALHQGADLHKIYDDMNENDYTDTVYKDKFMKTFLIKSINKNELSTVTLRFYKVPDQYDKECNDKIFNLIKQNIDALQIKYGLYTCDVQYYGDTKCILLKVVSVEKRRTAKHVIHDMNMDIMDNIHNQLFGNNEHRHSGKILNYYYYLISHEITIQIIGYNEIGEDKKTFDEEFIDWYKTQVFQNIVDIHKVKEDGESNRPKPQFRK